MRRHLSPKTTAGALFALYFAAAPLAGQQPVEVTLRSPTAEPVEGATVEFLSTDGPAFSQNLATDALGVARFDVPGVAATYRVIVRHPGWAYYETSIEIPKPRRSRVRTLEIDLNLSAKTGTERLSLAGESIRAGDYAAAEAYLREAVELDPELALAWTVLANVALTAERWADAADAAARALRIEPGNADSLRIRHDALVHLRRFDEAESTLDALIEVDPSRELARRLFNSGADAANREDDELARRRFRKALERDPTLWQAHSALAEVAISEQDYDAALASLDAALELSPGEKKLARRRVDVLRAAGREEEAAAAAAALGE